MKNITIVIPTYNERGNIEKLIKKIFTLNTQWNDLEMSLLIVDDNSPDGTGKIVTELGRFFTNIHLLEGKKEGLGKAYIRGIKYALENFNSDVIIQMDADLSHDPKYLRPLIDNILNGYDLAIGSRYVKGGSIPNDWPLKRVLNSKAGNFFAHYVAGIKKIKDCTSGFRAFNHHILNKLDWNKIHANGFSFQLNILYRIIQQKGKIIEIPIKFKDRTRGKSKLGIYDIIEFIYNAGKIRILSFAGHLPLLAISFLIVSTFTILFLTLSGQVQSTKIITYSILMLSIFMITQGVFTFTGLIYAWQEPERVAKNLSPTIFSQPQYSFTILIPALHEEKVIAETLRSIANINYPEKLLEILVICRADDFATATAVNEAFLKLNLTNAKLLVPPTFPKNKPDKLNFGLSFTNNEVLCVFDAEDSPHCDILNIVNTVMLRDEADVVQSGVQLIDYKSHWFSSLNVIEYFFWFKSVLHLFSQMGVIPLGGNTVFFKTHWLRKIGGWDADCLTEDADIGLRLSSAGAKFRIIYDESHATQEETPSSTLSFIKQRTRWNQGFLQIFKKMEWMRLPTFKQKFLAAFVLLWPEIQAMTFLYIVLAIVMIFTLKLPLVVALISNIPFYILIVQLAVMNIGLYEFTKKYNFKYSFWLIPKTLLAFLPYQTILGISALRAVYRETIHENGWEKTAHVGAHRKLVSSPTAVKTEKFTSANL
ncbi:MAG: glycosyltransferase [Candidatus Magasanikiibacteriota bacterium]